MRKLKIRNFFFKIHNLFITSGVGVYKRKQELDQESDQEYKKTRKKTKTHQASDQ